MVVAFSNVTAAAQALAGADMALISQNVAGTQRTRRTTLTAIKAFAFAVAGTAGAPGVPVAAATVGLFSGGSGATEFLGFSANGTEFMRSTSLVTTMALPTLFPVGSVSAPTIAVGTTNKGLFAPNPSSLGVVGFANIQHYIAGTEVIRHDAIGLRLQVGGITGSPADAFHVYSGTLSADVFRCSDSLGTVAVGGAPLSGYKFTVESSTLTQLRLLKSGTSALDLNVGFANAGEVQLYAIHASGYLELNAFGITTDGIKAQHFITDRTVLAAGIGGAIGLQGTYTGSLQTVFAAIKGSKENATDGETGGHLDLYSRANGSNLALNARLSAAGNLLLGTTTDDATCLFNLVSTTKGLGLPVWTTTQRDAISSPRTGLVGYNSTTGAITYYNGAAWLSVLGV